MSQPDNFYVAPVTPPAARRPPVRETGLLKWLRENLFNSPVDTVITIVTFAVVGYFLYGFLNWALFEAQWEVVFLNLRFLNLGGQFPQDAVWRAELIALIVVFLGLLSVGIWGSILRGYVIVVGIIAVMMIAVPILSQAVPEPPIHTFLAPKYAIRQVNFIADAGQVITFTIDPLTTVDEFKTENIAGFVENDNQQANTAFDAFSAASTEVVFTQQRDPSIYDLNVAVQVWDRDGNVIAESDFTNGSTENLVYKWTAPSSGWYTYTAVLDEENPGESGSAWLVADNIEVLRSTVSGVRERNAIYGEEPTLNCRGCATQVYRTDMRFQGKRTLGQWFSLQLTPFLLETRNLFFMSVIVGAVGYGIAVLAKTRHAPDDAPPSTTEKWLARISTGLFAVYILAQLFGISGGNPNTTTLYLFLLGALCASVILYAVMLLFKGSGQSRSMGVGLLWAISFPVILTLVNGIAGDPALKQIPSDEQGGLLLTLLLSAVAIIASFPIGLLLALGRQSTLPVVRLFCTIFIEVVRGVPLITLIFMGRLILPFFGMGLGNVDLLIRIMVVLTLFTSAYLAEVIRGGLQTVPKGQLEAAHALGFNEFYTNVLIVIPQALRLVIPAIMGQAVSLFKDTSLVYVIGLFELVGAMNQLLGDSQTGYVMFPREGYLFVGIVYFIFSYIMAETSRRVEKTGSGAVRRDTI